MRLSQTGECFSSCRNTMILPVLLVPQRQCEPPPQHTHCCGFRKYRGKRGLMPANLESLSPPGSLWAATVQHKSRFQMTTLGPGHSDSYGANRILFLFKPYSRYRGQEVLEHRRSLGSLSSSTRKQSSAVESRLLWEQVEQPLCSHG